MWIPKEMDRISQRLKDGGYGKRLTVRELLQMFGAERRGLNKVHDIRLALSQLDLVTDPDFESAWIDSVIRIRLSDGYVMPSGFDRVADGNSEDTVSPGDQSVVEDVPEQIEAAQVNQGAPPEIDVSTEDAIETATADTPDPTFRIGSLPEANKPLVTVGQDDPLNKAVTKMLQYEFSQLPIMQGERDIKGMISWRSIGSRYAMGGQCEKVRDCREDAQVIDANGLLFDAIPTIVKHGYVLVRDQQNRKITGIVTAADLSLQFQQLAEPFLLLREIELHIRQLLQDKVCPVDLESLASPENPKRKPASISDLSFGEYIRLLQRPEIWSKLCLNIDQILLTAQLEDVREIRNDVMHFDPDPMTSRQLAALKNAAKFMQQLYELLP